VLAIAVSAKHRSTSRAVDIISAGFFRFTGNDTMSWQKTGGEACLTF
jgi:hypothetical protein